MRTFVHHCKMLQTENIHPEPETCFKIASSNLECRMDVMLGVQLVQKYLNNQISNIYFSDQKNLKSD